MGYKLYYIIKPEAFLFFPFFGPYCFSSIDFFCSQFRKQIPWIDLRCLLSKECAARSTIKQAKATFESRCDESGSFTSVAADSRVWSARTLKFQVRHICSINNNNHMFNLNVLHVKMCIDTHVLITFLSADCNVTWEMSRTPSPMFTCTSLWSICLSYLKQLDCWFLMPPLR